MKDLREVARLVLEGQARKISKGVVRVILAGRASFGMSFDRFGPCAAGPLLWPGPAYIGRL